MINATVKELITAYGPIAFGLVAVLIIWWVIVAPELDRNSVRNESLIKSIEAQNKAAESFGHAVHALEITTSKLEKLADSLQRIPGPPR